MPDPTLTRDATEQSLPRTASKIMDMELPSTDLSFIDTELPNEEEPMTEAPPSINAAFLTETVPPTLNSPPALRVELEVSCSVTETSPPTSISP